MSGEWRKRRKRPWFDIFVEFKEIEKIMDEMTRQAFSKSKRFRPHVYGFSVTMGSDGTPRIREFGNVHKSRYGPRIMEQREPLVDVLDEEEEVVVVAEFPGVKKEDINIYMSKGGFIISVDTAQRKYHKELSLPEEVDPKGGKASYKNGVLEVRFKKKDKGKKMQIQ